MDIEMLTAKADAYDLASSLADSMGYGTLSEALHAFQRLKQEASPPKKGAERIVTYITRGYVEESVQDKLMRDGHVGAFVVSSVGATSDHQVEVRFLK